MQLYSWQNSIPYSKNTTTNTPVVGCSPATYGHNDCLANSVFSLFVFMTLLLLATPSLANSSGNNIGVVYPKVREPYNKIFLSIIDEIKKSTDHRVLAYEVAKGNTSKELSEWLDNKSIKKIVGLGNRGIRIVYQLDNKSNWPIVFGASAINPEKSHDFFALSLVPKPMKLFEKLSEVNKGINTIYVIYEIGKQDELIHLSESSAKALGFQLVAYGASNVVEMAEMYRKVLKKINPKTDALWMSKSGRPIEKAIMNEVLRDAWRNKFIVFSSNLTDVKKGALFSLYPNNKKTGKKLIEILDSIQDQPGMKPRVVLSDSLNAGLNIRTAAHLGIHFGEEEKRRYSLIFPPQ